MFETKRLIIRRFTPDDAQDLFEYLADPETVKFEPYYTFSKSAAADEARRRAKDSSFWAVCLKDTHKMIGNLYFCQQQPTDFDTWELGYVFNPLFTKKGYATESALKILEYGFESCGAHRIVAHCDPENTASWHLLERLHMRREGHMLKTAFFKWNEEGIALWHDTYAYAMLSEEWAENAKNRQGK